MIISAGGAPDELVPFSGRWQIAIFPAGLDIYTAERREGSTVRYIVAPSVADLASKLAAIEAGQ